MAEAAVREALRLRGLDPPRQCATCRFPLEALRDGTGTLILRCAGRCGRQDGRSARELMTASGTAALPGFEP